VSRTLEWVTEAVGPGSRIAAIRKLPSTWLANHAVDVVDRGGRLHRLVLRRWARPGWDVDDPDFSAERERAILVLLADSGVPAPRLVAADPDAAVCDVPALLLTRLPGHPPGPAETADVSAFLAQLAAALPVIHAVRARLPVYRPYYEVARLTPRSKLWERAFEVLAGPVPDLPSCFIHRDYHPGNTLWSRRRLTGVVDWTTASWGPAAVDLGHMRWNLALDYGIEAADRFLALSDESGVHHPYWDLRTVVDLGPDLDPRLEAYVAAVLAQL